MTLVVAVATARADGPADPTAPAAPATDAGEPPEVGQLFVDGEPLPFDCARPGSTRTS